MRAGVDKAHNICRTKKYDIIFGNFLRFAFIVIYVIIAVLLVSVSCIIVRELVLRRRNGPLSGSSQGGDQSYKHATVILLAITVSYFAFSFSPQILLLLFYRLDVNSALRHLLTMITALLVCIHHTNNFWLYIASSKIYRRKFRELIDSIVNQIHNCTA